MLEAPVLEGGGDTGERRFYEAAALRAADARPASARSAPARSASARPALGLPLAFVAWLGLPWRERWRWARRKVLEGVLRAERLQTADRAILEQQVLAGYAADPALRSLLFVGCDWYTKDYVSMFAPDGARFRTIDIDPKKARFGSSAHIVAPLQDAAQHLAPGSIDAIVCNGVLGFGIDERVELARALDASLAVLRPGGSMVFGWNDVPALAPFDPSEVAFTSGFVTRRDGARAERWRIRTDTPTRHTFDLYLKPTA